MVDAVDEPGNNGGSNDRTLVLWNQLKEVTKPSCWPGIQSVGGTNAWESESAARAAFKSLVAGAAKITASMQAANEKATSPSNIASSVASDVASGAAAAVDVAGKAAGGALATASTLWVAEALVGGLVAYFGVKWWLGQRK